MTWLDAVAILVLLVCMGLGARLGSLWAGGCLIAGFAGGFLVDYYAIPLGGMLGQFPGATVTAAVILITAALVLVLVPAALLSRISSAVFLGVVNSAFGLVVGGCIGLLVLGLAVLLVVPLAPRIEKGPAWQKSGLVKPFQRSLEEKFNTPHFRPVSAAKKLKREAVEELEPKAEKAEEKVKGWVERIRKRFQRK